MKNLQRPWPREVSDGTLVTVHSIFPTIQGEGPHVGRPAVFVRLAGCNLQCPACDTLYTEGVQTYDPMNLCDIVEGHCLANGIFLVVVTGGEPFRQNISQFVKELVRRDIQVQVETNGMLAPQGFASSWLADAKETGSFLIVVSPKTHKLDGLIGEYAAAFKYVITAGQVADDRLPLSALDHPIPKGHQLARPLSGWKGPIYVQPADLGDPYMDAANLLAAIDAVFYNTRETGKDFRLCLQIHKIAGLD